MLIRKFFSGLILLTSIAIGLVGCGSDEGDGLAATPGQQRLGEATALGLEQLAAAVERFFELPDAIEDPGMPPVGISYDSTNSAFVIEIDFDAVPGSDTTLSGNVVGTSGNLADGFDVFEAFTVDWSVSGAFTGNGSLKFSLAAVDDLTVEGQGTLTATASTFIFSIRNRIHFDPRATSLTIPVNAVLGRSGVMEIDVAAGGDTLLGTMYLTPEEAFVEYAPGKFFYIDYDFFEVFFED